MALLTPSLDLTCEGADMITVFGEGRGFRGVWLLEETRLPYLMATYALQFAHRTGAVRTRSVVAGDGLRPPALNPAADTSSGVR